MLEVISNKRDAKGRGINLYEYFNSYTENNFPYQFNSVAYFVKYFKE